MPLFHDRAAGVMPPVHSQTSGRSQVRYSGDGPGEQTLDGCSVEFYKQLPVMGEVSIIASGYPPPATLLELGCGAGHLSSPLSEMGYRITGIDNSEAMLKSVEGATVVLSDIESLELNQKFEVVLLASSPSI